MGSAVDFEIYDLFVCIYEVLIVVLVSQAILKRKLANVSALLKLLVDLTQQKGYLLNVRPHVRLDLREDHHAIDLDLECTMPRKGHKLIGFCIKIAMHARH